MKHLPKSRSPPLPLDPLPLDPLPLDPLPPPKMLEHYITYKLLCNVGLKPCSCAQFATGSKFASECNFGHVNGVLRMHFGSYILGGANCAHELSRWCKYICTRVQIVHMNAKRLISIHFDRSLICGRPFLFRICINRYKMNIKLFLSK